jgi:4-amino-4-deoxy-L-arabinose transferase-like glycosyltransferase
MKKQKGSSRNGVPEKTMSAEMKRRDSKRESSIVAKHAFLLSEGFLLGIVIVSVVTLRSIIFYFTTADPYLQFRVGDELHYHEWALRILGGQWARGTSFFTTPLYAYFLALTYWLCGDGILTIRLLNLLMGIGALILTYLTARCFLDHYASLIAAGLFGLCTSVIFYEWFPEKTSLVLFLTSLSFYSIAQAICKRRLTYWLLAGIFVGVASLGHMLLFVILPAVWIHIAFNYEKAKAAALKAILIFTGGVLLGISPATVHNWLQDGDFVLVASNGGQNFYVGNHTGNFTGEYISPPFSVANIDNEEANFKHEAERRSQRSMKPSEVSRFWFQQGWREIKQEPGLALKRFWNRLRWAAGAEEPSDTRTFELYQTRYRILGFPFWGFGLVACLGLAGLVFCLSNRAYLVLSCTVLFFIIGISLFFVYGRYRLPLLIPLSIFAAVALQKAYRFTAQHNYRVLAALCITTGIFALLVHGRVLPDLQVSFLPDYYNQGNKYWNLGKYDLAIAEYEKALTVRPADHPGVSPLFAKLIHIYLSNGQVARAEALVQNMMPQFPTDQSLQETLVKIKRMRQDPTLSPRTTNQ